MFAIDLPDQINKDKFLLSLLALRNAITKTLAPMPASPVFGARMGIQILSLDALHLLGYNYVQQKGPRQARKAI
ncbi:MAG: hypothetical protein LBL23_04245, partial [Coriobacteriales bacterium]|nr:hypothetical protein [Coriobacteriales bacterium]